MVAPEGRNVGPACPCKRVVNEEVVQDRAPDLNSYGRWARGVDIRAAADAGAAMAVVLSAPEDEYMALGHAGREVVWLRNLLAEMGLERYVQEPTIIEGDNLQTRNSKAKMEYSDTF